MNAWPAAGLLLALAGCGDDAPPITEGRGIGTVTTSEAPRGVGPTGTGTNDPRAPLEQGDPEPPTVTTTAPPSSAVRPEPEARDLAAELRQLMGDPGACIPTTLDRTTVEISVLAFVSSAGIVTRVEASGSGLSEDARQCVEARLDGARFPREVPNAPRSVHTTFQLERRPAETRETAPSDMQ
ncbi:MAG: hypothetical protein AAGF12_40090 [Myxococcota bacterium]